MDQEENNLIRLHKAMAQRGIASRRKAEGLIAEGHVKVNGITVKEQGKKVKDTDIIEVDGLVAKPLLADSYTYILLNKPEGIISSVQDTRKRKTVIDIVRKEIKERVYPVGRLDYDTSGLLLLTNDGELTYRLTHPSYGVLKTYRVYIRGELDAQALQTLQTGVLLEDGLTSPAKINAPKKEKRGNGLSLVEISIHEGKNRQVRRMFAKVGYPVCSLKRIAFGPIHLENEIKPGQYRMLTQSEVISLKKAVRLK